MLTDRLIQRTEDLLVGREVSPDVRARARASTDSSLRSRVYREGMMPAVWAAFLFAMTIIVIGIDVVLNSMAPASTGVALLLAGVLGAFCLTGMAIHMVRYAVLLCVGLVRTGQLIGASRQIRAGPPRPQVPLAEPRWFVRLTSATDADFIVQLAAVVGILVVLSIAHSHGP